MLRNDSEIFSKFGEIYFSISYPKAIKAWHMHKDMILNYACIEGKLKLVLYDDRANSKTFGKIQELTLSTDDYFLVTVPPLIWNGFVNIGNNNSILANCSSVPYRDDEIIRKSPFDKQIPYIW
jgi:dTDP-4-dehydrorhamnose 3,5-epimerase